MIQKYLDILKHNNLIIECSQNLITDLPIDHITYNSKDVTRNTMFVCKGLAFKEDYLHDAIKNGAICYVSEKKYNCDIPYILVKDVRKSMAYLAKTIYNNAYEKFNLIGITGTKGKSTTSYYLKYILDEYLSDNNMSSCGILSTNDVFDGVLTQKAELTTPEALPLHKHFYNAATSKLKFLEMEVSSQALKYDRVLGVKFDTCAFLNISVDHISENEHKDFEDYFSSKLKLFSQSKTACVNLDSDYSERILTSASVCKNIITFSQKSAADIFGYNVQKIDNEIHFNVKTKTYDKPFVLTMAGLFNVENALCAIAICYNYGIDYKYIYNGLKKARSAGRMEVYTDKNKTITVIVDYAHNKLSFEKLFSSVKQEYKDSKIVSLFGCPGNKAKNRRKELGEIAAKYSDDIYLTQDDSGYENIEDINNEILSHTHGFDCKCVKINDRGDAIKKAILNAKENSVILLLGKGSEKHQKCFGKLDPYLSDIEYAKKYLDEYDKIKK